MKQMILLVSCVIAASSTSSAATPTFYSSLASFNTAAGNPASFGFNSLVSGNASVSYATSAGLSLNGFQFVGTNGNGGYYLGAEGPAFIELDYDRGTGSSLQGPAVASVFYHISNGVLTITMPPGGVTAFGLQLWDVLTSDYTGAGTDTVHLTVNGSSGTVVTPAFTGTGFIGFTSSTPVTSVTLTGTALDEFPTISAVYYVAAPAAQTLPHVADGNGFDTEVLLINTGTTSETYSMQFFNQSGAQVTYQLDPAQSGMTGTIQPGAQAIVRTAGSGTSTHLGWGQVTASSAVRGMVIYQQQASPTSFQEGSAPFALPSMHLFFPFDNTGGSTTSIGFVNPSSSQTAAVTFTVRYASGGTDNVPVFNVNPLQQIAETVASAWPNTANQRGLIEVNATSPVGLVAFRFQGSALTLFDTIAPTAAGSTPVTSTIAHSADGNGFRSTFILTNSGTVAEPYTLSILNAKGQPQTFGFDVANPLSGTVPAGSTLTIDTTGLGTTTNLGWAQLMAAPAVSGIEVFRQTNPGQSEQQATIPISQTNSAHFFLPFDDVTNTTSIALANPDPSTTATINVTFRYTDGTSNTGQLTLAAQNYNANLLATLFPVTTGKAGVAEFTSNVPIAVVEVRFNPTQAFTSLRAVGP